MAKAHWLVKQSEKGGLSATKVRRRGEQFYCTPVQAIDNLDNLIGKVAVALESDKTIALVDDFALIKDNVLSLQIHQKIDRLALFEVNEQITVAHRFLAKRRHLQRLSVIACSENTVTDGIQTMIAGGKRELALYVSNVAAIAALLQQVNTDPFIALYISEHTAFLAGIKDGAVFSLQSVPLAEPAVVESGVAAHALSFARQNLERDFEFNNCRLICLGVGRENFDFAGLGEENWIPDFSHCLQSEGNEIAMYPDLFGLLFMESDSYSFLPDSYRFASRLKKTAALLTGGAVAGSIILTALAYFNYQDNQSLLLQLTKERTELSLLAGEVHRLIPDEERFKQVETFKNIRDRAKSEPSVGMLLADISRVLPDGVYITNLKIERIAGNNDENEARAMRAMDMDEEYGRSGLAQAPAERLLRQQIIVNLNCISTGEFSHVKARFHKTVAGLSSKFILEDLEWQYDETNRTGYLSSRLLLLESR